MESISLPENACYKVHCIRYLLHHYIGINLRSVDAGMPKKFARRVDVCPSCQGHCGKGVAACVQNYRDCRLKQMKAVGTVNSCK